jgi:hypothetical protein
MATNKTSTLANLLHHHLRDLPLEDLERAANGLVMAADHFNVVERNLAKILMAGSLPVFTRKNLQVLQVCSCTPAMKPHFTAVNFPQAEGQCFGKLFLFCFALFYSYKNARVLCSCGYV